MRNLNLCQNQLIAVFKNKEKLDHFIVGTILAMDDAYIVLRLFNENGEYDGITCLSQREIMYYETGTKYLNKISSLVKDKENVELFSLKAEQPVLNAFLLYCQQSALSVEIRKGKRRSKGIILSLSNKSVHHYSVPPQRYNIKEISEVVIEK